MRGTVAVAFACVVLGAGVPRCAAAQRAQPSQRGEVRQRVAEAEVSVVYDRPVARGRELFGALVPWDRMWTPAANRAAVLEVSRPVTVAGQALLEGRYSVWFVPREAGPWEVIVSRAWDRHHLRYAEGEDVFRVDVVPGQGEHMETLAWYFPAVDGVTATLRIHWGTTVLDLPLTVPPPAAGG